MAKAKMRRAIKRKNFRRSIPNNGMNDPNSFDRPEGHPLPYPKVMTYREEESGAIKSYLGPDKKPIIVADAKEHNAFLEHLRKNPKRVKGVTENLEKGVSEDELEEEDEVVKKEDDDDADPTGETPARKSRKKRKK